MYCFICSDTHVNSNIIYKYDDTIYLSKMNIIYIINILVEYTVYIYTVYMQ